MSEFIDEKVRRYMVGWCEGVTSTRRGKPLPTDEDERRGYQDGADEYAQTEQHERQRLEQEQRELDFIEWFADSGECTFVPAAGSYIGAAASMMRRLATRSRRTIRSTFNDTPVEARPGEAEEVILARWEGRRQAAHPDPVGVYVATEDQ